jgi:hypothetical protein
MTTQQQKLFQMFETYYDVGLDNCFMTHEDWIINIVDALTDDKYLEKMMVFFKEYAEERECETAYTKDYDWPFKLTD